MVLVVVDKYSIHWPPRWVPAMAHSRVVIATCRVRRARTTPPRLVEGFWLPDNGGPPSVGRRTELNCSAATQHRCTCMQDSPFPFPPSPSCPSRAGVYHALITATSYSRTTGRPSALQHRASKTWIRSSARKDVGSRFLCILLELGTVSKYSAKYRSDWCSQRVHRQ